MDENIKKQFKWKFYHLTIELNIIILLVAMTIPLFLIIHTPLTLPVIVIMLAAALAISLDFVKRYHEAKAWLDNNTDQESDSKTESES